MKHKIRKVHHTAVVGAKVLLTKGPKVFVTMSFAKLRSFRLRRTRAEIADEYNYVSNPIFAITEDDIKQSQKATASAKPNRIKTANWFVPYFEHAAYGGAYTILRFVNYFQSQGVQNRIIIYDRNPTDAKQMRKKIVQSFPLLQDAELILFTGEVDKLQKMPACDIAFCTSWQSAYFLLKFNKTKRKYYCAMDYEPLFYPAGAIYALAESTYRFPFRGLVNTPGLLMALNKRHGLEGISYVPAVDRHIYKPETEADLKRHSPIRVFFYTRPNNLRNAFTLMVIIMRLLKQKYGDDIQIVTAGAEWDERSYGLRDAVENKGLLRSLGEVADLYRTCDIGVIYMLSKHPSYQPFEYMASGMATVTNKNEDNLWLFRHEENCLLAEPSATSMTEQIIRLIEDESLRQSIVKHGLKTVENEWDWQTDIIWNDIKNN